MEAFVTKYALTKGIKKIECRPVDPRVIAETIRGYTVYYYGNEWHKSLQAACARVREMIASKEASLNKQLVKLKKLKEGYM